MKNTYIDIPNEKTKQIRSLLVKIPKAREQQNINQSVYLPF